MTNENRIRRADILLGLTIVSVLTISVGLIIDEWPFVVFGGAIAAGIVAGALP